MFLLAVTKQGLGNDIDFSGPTVVFNKMQALDEFDFPETLWDVPRLRTGAAVLQPPAVPCDKKAANQKQRRTETSLQRQLEKLTNSLAEETRKRKRSECNLASAKDESLP